MVDALHAAGLEVVLDVVFNHTAEGDHTGPTLCHRGLDNPAYYRLDPDDPGRYVDTTGCGNALNAGDPLALQLIMDSLRYWLTEMHVDGFRFDLAPTLARQDGGFDRVVGVLRPGLPGPGGVAGQADRRAVGRRPGRQLRRRPVPAAVEGVERPYRDTMRDFWRSHDGLLGEFATRFAGSSDLYGGARAATDRLGQPDHRARRLHPGRPGLLRRQAQRGQRRGQPRRHRRQPLLELRRRGPDRRPRPCSPCAAARPRALLTTLLLSFGVPMLLGGDELGRTQQGNNNAYCQDNAITWFDWSHVDDELLGFTRRLIALRRAHPVFRRRRFLAGDGRGRAALVHPGRHAMTATDWADPSARSVAIYLDGADAPDRADDGTPLLDDDFLVLVNGWWEPLDFTVPPTRPGQTWYREIDTFDPAAVRSGGKAGVADPVDVGPRSVVVLQGSPGR